MLGSIPTRRTFFFKFVFYDENKHLTGGTTTAKILGFLKLHIYDENVYLTCGTTTVKLLTITSMTKLRTLL